MERIKTMRGKRIAQFLAKKKKENSRGGVFQSRSVKLRSSSKETPNLLTKKGQNHYGRGRRKPAIMNYNHRGGWKELLLDDQTVLKRTPPRTIQR